jgi:hypothetical protein
VLKPLKPLKGKRRTKGSGICGRKGIKALKKAIRRFWKVKGKEQQKRAGYTHTRNILIVSRRDSTTV